MKAYIDVRHCGANKDYCKSMKECPHNAIVIKEDQKSGFGIRFVVDEDKCDGCGLCVDLCCGECITMKEEDKEEKEDDHGTV